MPAAPDGLVTSFSALHPSVRYLVTEVLRFPALRPVQELTVGPVLAGQDVVVLAPTAGGKTEAAVLPILSRILFEERPPIALLYVAPLRALLNNLHPRVSKMAEAVGVECGRWHGDVPASEKKRIRQNPPHILLITPESLEVLLMGDSSVAKRLLGNVGLAVVDEVHAFAADARGGHLMSLLERIQLLTRRHIQRVGLSATVGDPEVLAGWLQGTGASMPAGVVRPPADPRSPLIDFVAAETTGEVVSCIRKRGAGKKCLVFAGSRGRTEDVGFALQDAGVPAFVHHSSVSKDERGATELAFEDQPDAVIVATSTLELGIDIGDLDLVFQIDAPRTVSSLAQRLGRTGRRPGTSPTMTFLLGGVEDLLVAAALTRLFVWEQWVEPVAPERRSWIVLAHQVFANLLETGGCRAADLAARLRLCSAFSEIADEEIREVVDHLVRTAYIDEADGLLLFGARAEAEFGSRNFSQMYAVFEAPVQLSVRDGSREIGTLETTFALQVLRKGRAFRLAGRAWTVADLDLSRSRVQVLPAPDGAVPFWTGQPSFLSRRLCETILRLLTERSLQRGLDTVSEHWLRDAWTVFGDLGLDEEHRPLERKANEYVWHTFAGGRINAVLARLLNLELGVPCTCSNLSVKLRTTDPLVGSRMAEALLRWRTGGFPPTATWADIDTSGGQNLLSRFQGCLPPAFEQEFLRTKLLDVEGAMEWLSLGFSPDQVWTPGAPSSPGSDEEEPVAPDGAEAAETDGEQGPEPCDRSKSDDQKESELVTACALRFDGYGWFRARARSMTNEDVDGLAESLPSELLKSFLASEDYSRPPEELAALLFIIQRWWIKEGWLEWNEQLARVTRRLFLETCRWEPSEEFRAEEWLEGWQGRYQARLGEWIDFVSRRDREARYERIAVLEKHFGSDDAREQDE